MGDKSDNVPSNQPSPPPDESKPGPTEGSTSALELPQEVLNQLPPTIRQQIGIGFAATMAAPPRSGPDRLLERIPEDQAADVVALIVAHSDKELDLQHAEKIASIQARERQTIGGIASDERRQVRALWFAFGVILLAVSLAGVCIFAGKDQLAMPVLSALLGAAGGFGLGRGTRDKGRS